MDQQPLSQLLPPHPDLIICDLEATCWNDGEHRHEMEIIEIGAVRIHQGAIIDQFSAFVRPVVHPKLSDFCKALTSITQYQVDEAQPFPMVFPQFIEWIGHAPFVFCSWGHYDVHQLQHDVAQHQLTWPVKLDRHLNIKRCFALFRNVQPCGMERALQLMKIPLEGTHHRGIDDAHNIARLTLLMLPWMLRTQSILQMDSVASPNL
ncbi:MAG TPA: 3'-5' exonuclease [Gemmatales bacterium]|nr:3'-5' exonuclease [Gemmatales bacterium]